MRIILIIKTNKAILRMIRKELAVSLSLVLSMAMVPAMANAQPAAEPAADDDPQATREIIVIGQKLENTLQDTAGSVVVAGRDAIDNGSYWTVEDYLRAIPGISFSSARQLPSVRGIDGNGVATGGFGAVSGGRPRITTYVDGVPRAYSFVPNGIPPTWDIDQLAFYRGSQSTAIGRNAAAGAIIVETRDPVDRFEGAAQLGSRNAADSVNGALTLNAPLAADRLALRVSAEGFTGDGFVTYVGPLAPVNKRLSREEGYRLRGKLLWRPKGFGDDTELRLAYERQYSRGPSPSDTVDFPNAKDLTMSTPSSISFFELRNDLVSIEGRLPIDDTWSLYGIASYQNAREVSPAVITGDPNFLDVFANSKEWTQEARLTYAPAGTRTQIAAGVFHFTRNRIEGGRPGSAFVYDATDKASTIAVFADAVIEAGPFDILAGGRWERERQDRNFLADFGLGLDADIRQSIFLPKAGVRWNIDDDRSLTALYYKGYSPAGAGVSFLSFNPYQFDRETSNTAELALRAAFPASGITINANAYYTRYRGQQLSGFGPQGIADSFIVNAERTRQYGVEAAATWDVNDAVTLDASVAFTDARIIRFGDPLNDESNGNRPAISPVFSGRIGAKIKPMEGLELQGNVGYTGGYFTLDRMQDEYRVPSRVVADFRGSYTTGPVTLQLAVENLFNNFYLTNTDPQFGTSNVGRPRTVSASVKVNF
jgi:iron complex outermembrane recepter protein